MTTEWHLRRAARWVHQGGVIAYPTEAVFGIGCLPAEGEAVQRIFRIKGRTITKGLILIAADLDQLLPYIQGLPPRREPDILASWPGPFTWILPARTNAPRWLTGGRDTLAVRVTAHPTAAALCRACDSALVSTSANRSGAPPARTGLRARQCLGDSIDYLVPGRVGDQRNPTRILDASSRAIVRR